MSAGRRLLRSLQASAQGAGCPVRVTATQERPWASATFVGTEHVVALEGLASPELSSWLANLGERFAVPGHVVAEFAVRQVSIGAELTVLTLEAGT